MWLGVILFCVLLSVPFVVDRALRFRKRLSPQWHTQRLVHFIVDVDLPSTCSIFGHEIEDDDCKWCTDLVKIPATWHAKHIGQNRIFTLGIDWSDDDPYGSGGEHYYHNDPRILGFIPVRSRWSLPDDDAWLGYALCDPNAPRKDDFGSYGRPLPEPRQIPDSALDDAV